MANCKECSFFFPISEDADDFEQGKGDCVNEKKDEKGKYWLSRPAFEGDETCEIFNKK